MIDNTLRIEVSTPADIKKFIKNYKQNIYTGKLIIFYSNNIDETLSSILNNSCITYNELRINTAFILTNSVLRSKTYKGLYLNNSYLNSYTVENFITYYNEDIPPPIMFIIDDINMVSPIEGVNIKTNNKKDVVIEELAYVAWSIDTTILIFDKKEANNVNS